MRLASKRHHIDDDSSSKALHDVGHSSNSGTGSEDASRLSGSGAAGSPSERPVVASALQRNESRAAPSPSAAGGGGGGGGGGGSPATSSSPSSSLVPPGANTSGPSEFSGLVSYFSSQQDDLE